MALRVSSAGPTWLYVSAAEKHLADLALKHLVVEAMLEPELMARSTPHRGGLAGGGAVAEWRPRRSTFSFAADLAVILLLHGDGVTQVHCSGHM